MSEEILNAIIKLLAIVAAEDDVTVEERAFIETYLKDSLDTETASRFLSVFDELIRNDQQVEDSKKIRQICSQINLEQTAQQKVVIILNLVILIAADGIVSKRENELLYEIAGHLNIPKNVTDLIKAFVIYQERSKIISSNILIVDDGSHEVNSKCKHHLVPNFAGFIFILRIPELEMHFAKYIGEENIFLNGSIMRNDKIYNFSTGSVIKLQNETLYHSEVAGKFRELAAASHLSFIAQDLTFKFKSGKIGLQEINLEEESGKLIALMGGSGAGKSTLLNVLNGNETPSSGSVRINGIDIHQDKKDIEGIIGYVPQDDLLIEELTVFDNLYYAAKLCFRNYSDKRLRVLVNKTLEALGLFETKHLKVGSPLDKTISGGQRKRLNIGLELLREPAVMFVDEPTSGLSSRDSENIMDLLKELSLKGKLVFVVIHQPSEEIFKMFDKLLILDVGGYQIYYGNPTEAVSYFKEAVNMVDHGRSSNPEQIFNIIESKVVNEFGNFTNKRKISPKEWRDHFVKKISIPSIKEQQTVPPKNLKIPNKFKQLVIFMLRDLKSKISNRQYLTINLLEGPFLALLLAFIVRYLPEDASTYHFNDNDNIPVFFFMSIIVALFMGLTVSAEEIIKDRKVLKREEFLNLSRLSYLFSKVFILFSLSAIQTLSFVIIGELILEIKGMTLSFWITLFSVSCFANSLGLIISSAFKSAITVYILIPLLIIPQIILSGIVVSFDKLNPVITAKDKVPMIGEVMTSRWAFEALAVEQFVNNEYEKNFYEQDLHMADAEFKTVYLFPKLESNLEYVQLHKGETDPKMRKEVSHRLATVKNEFEKLLELIGKDKFPSLSDLKVETYDQELHQISMKFISDLNRHYNKIYKIANEEKQEILRSLTESKADLANFNQLQQAYDNEAIAFMVKNTGTAHRIIEHKNELIQKIYPIFNIPDHPDHVFDFRAQFFQPVKHFGGRYFSTPSFNILVIWSMIIFLFIVLYFDWLRKLLSGFSRK